MQQKEEQLYDHLTKREIPFAMYIRDRFIPNSRYEYIHPTWSYHAKGLWILNKNSSVEEGKTDTLATIGIKKRKE